MCSAEQSNDKREEHSSSTRYLGIIPVELNGHLVTAFADTGATESFIRPELASTIEPCNELLVELADGTTTSTTAITHVDCRIGKKVLNIPFYILTGLSTDAILGLDAQAHFNLSVHARSRRVVVDEQEIPFLRRKLASRLCMVTTQKLMALPKSGKYTYSREVNSLFTAKVLKLGSQPSEPLPSSKVELDKSMTAQEMTTVTSLIDSNVLSFTSKARPSGEPGA